MDIYKYIKTTQAFTNNYKIIPLYGIKQFYFKSDISEYDKIVTLLKINGLYYNFVNDPCMWIKVNNEELPRELVIATNPSFSNCVYGGTSNILIDENNIIQFDYYYDKKYHSYCVSIDIMKNE